MRRPSRKAESQGPPARALGSKHLGFTGCHRALCDYGIEGLCVFLVWGEGGKVTLSSDGFGRCSSVVDIPGLGQVSSVI